MDSVVILTYRDLVICVWVAVIDDRTDDLILAHDVGYWYWALPVTGYSVSLKSFPTDTAKPPDMEKAEVVTDYDAKSSDELTVQVGETVEIIDKEKDSDGWWKVRIIMVQGCHIYVVPSSNLLFVVIIGNYYDVIYE